MPSEIWETTPDGMRVRRFTERDLDFVIESVSDRLEFDGIVAHIDDSPDEEIPND